MSDAGVPDELTDGLSKQEVMERAYTAVESASSWLARRRREADDSNTDPYGDPYTTKYAPGADDSGYMSSAEGTTALFMVLSHDEENSGVYLSPQIDEDILTDDIEWLLTNDDEQGIEDGVYRATPYLPKDATTGFTDSVSFTTTTLQEAIKVPGVDVSDSRLKEALQRNERWLLKNYVESQTGTDGIGWAWCGAEEMENMDQPFPPQRYFTYSGTVALVDLYKDEGIDTHDEEIEQVLTRVLKHLLKDYWTELGGQAGWTEFNTNPYGNGLEPNTYNRDLGVAMPTLFSTSNTLFAVGYIYDYLPDHVWEGADISQEDIARLHLAIDFLIDTVTSQITDGLLEETSQVYKTGAKETTDGTTASRGYTDGSLPYTILNTLIAMSNTDGPFDYRNDEIERLKLATADYILENCWTGDTGFKHFEKDRDEEPVVIYTSQLAIESLLWFGLKPPEDDIKNQIVMELEETQKEIAHLLENHSVDTASSESSNQSAGIKQAGVLNRSYDFSETLLEVQRKYESKGSFDTDIWYEIEPKLSSDAKNKAMGLADNDLGKELEEINVFEFLLMLSECYHATSEEEFIEAIDHYQNENGIFLLKPQRQVVNSLSDLDSDTVTKFEERTEYIHDVLRRFKKDPLLENDITDVATDFRDRLESL